MMLKQLLRYDYVPICHSILCEELQFLQQGSKSVNSYYEKMQTLMLRCEIDESVEKLRIDFCMGFNLKFRMFLLISITLLFHNYLNLLVWLRNNF